MDDMADESTNTNKPEQQIMQNISYTARNSSKC